MAGYDSDEFTANSGGLTTTYSTYIRDISKMTLTMERIVNVPMNEEVKARLDAEIQEKKDSRDDTVKDHIYNLQIDGLDKLSTQLNDDYEKYCKELSSSVDKIEETFTSLSGTISSEGAKIDSTITTILGHYGVKPSDLGLTDSKVTGYAQGGLVKSVHKNGDDGLASLAVGEEVATVDVVNLANKVRQDKVLNSLSKWTYAERNDYGWNWNNGNQCQFWRSYWCN